MKKKFLSCFFLATFLWSQTAIANPDESDTESQRGNLLSLAGTASGESNTDQIESGESDISPTAIANPDESDTKSQSRNLLSRAGVTLAEAQEVHIDQRFRDFYARNKNSVLGAIGAVCLISGACIIASSVDSPTSSAVLSTTSSAVPSTTSSAVLSPTSSAVPSTTSSAVLSILRATNNDHFSSFVKTINPGTDFASLFSDTLLGVKSEFNISEKNEGQLPSTTTTSPSTTTTSPSTTTTSPSTTTTSPSTTTTSLSTTKKWWSSPLSTLLSLVPLNNPSTTTTSPSPTTTPSSVLSKLWSFVTSSNFNGLANNGRVYYPDYGGVNNDPDYNNNGWVYYPDYGWVYYPDYVLVDNGDPCAPCSSDFMKALYPRSNGK